MNPVISRRRWLASTASAGLALGLDQGGLFPGLPRLGAEEVAVSPQSVRFRPEIEPLVRFLEETPRERLLEETGRRIQEGARYRDLLAALLLAGVRNIQPRPVGFKFHAVLVVHSAHLASQNSPEADRWLPLFWALDYFKSSQARDVAEGDWTMAALDEKAVPPTERARREFIAAMDRWDVARTDVAVAGFARGTGAQEIFDLFCRYGARDFRDIGHKAIYVANSWRALQTIGWQHAEPVLRSLAYALLEHGGGNPADGDDRADLPGRHNSELLHSIRAGWTGGVHSPEATRDLLAGLRQGDWKEAADAVVAQLNQGVTPQSLWDALFQHANELLMRRPGIVSLHAVTTTNALHYAWQQCGADETRRFLLLQNASFLTLFRDAAGAREGLLIDTFEPVDAPATLEEIFAEVGHDRLLAARRTLAWLRQGGDVTDFMNAAQRFIYLKGTDSHDYKFSAAALENFAHLSPGVRERFLAASTFWLKGSTASDNTLVARTRAALG